MIDGDEIFVICGKETDDAIEVNRIAKVKLKQESKCYTAETEHKSAEIHLLPFHPVVHQRMIMIMQLLDSLKLSM